MSHESWRVPTRRKVRHRRTPCAQCHSLNNNHKDLCCRTHEKTRQIGAPCTPSTPKLSLTRRPHSPRHALFPRGRSPPEPTPVAGPRAATPRPRPAEARPTNAIHTMPFTPWLWPPWCGNWTTESMMDPLTLRFRDPRVEDALRSSQFRASFVPSIIILALQMPAHIFMSYLSEDYLIITYIYVPVIAVAAASRCILRFMADTCRAHVINARVWTACIVTGNACQRVALHLGIHPRIGTAECLLYMAGYLLIVLSMFLSHFSFSHKLASTASIFFCASTSGWSFTAGHGWTTLGQPVDTLFAFFPIAVGWTLGHCIEHMLRSSYASREGAAAGLSRGDPKAELRAELLAERFEELGLLGRGSCADVYLVRRGGSGGELYAMKRISKAALAPQQVERVLEESRILSSVDHPFLVALEYSFESDHCFYFAMTYADGGSLAQWLQPPMGRAAVRLVISEVLLALQYLHATGIIYRDLKPENTLVLKDGHILLADFGVSTRIGRPTLPTVDLPVRRAEPLPPVNGASSAASTHASTANVCSTVVGTIAYMAPEVLEGRAYAFEVDFWAMAVMMHEMLTLCTVGSHRQPQIDTDELAPDATDLLTRMLAVDRASRLGSGPTGGGDIMAHAYFVTVDFSRLLGKSEPGPLVSEQLTLQAPPHASSLRHRHPFTRDGSRPAP